MTHYQPPNQHHHQRQDNAVLNAEAHRPGPSSSSSSPSRALPTLNPLLLHLENTNTNNAGGSISGLTSIYNGTLSLSGTLDDSHTRDGDGDGQAKKRRVRSGCLTCRSRKVKCDEVRPRCKRCVMGTRDVSVGVGVGCVEVQTHHPPARRADASRLPGVVVSVLLAYGTGQTDEDEDEVSRVKG
jgi:hypothetical protein